MSADAKVLTTADVEDMPHYSERPHAHRIVCPNHVIVRRDELLATTRALETAQAALLDVHDALYQERTGKANLPDEIRSLRTRAEKAETKAAVDAMCEWGSLKQEFDAAVAKIREKVRAVEAERDAARRELAELALEVGYGERPEGQGGIIHADGKTLARTWLLERKEKDQAVADRDEAQRDVDALLKTLLETVPTEYVDGRWVVASGANPQAVITYGITPSPETGHVGWCWWALGEMGDAPSYEAACRAAVAAVREVERRHSPRVCRSLAKAKGGAL